MRHISDIYESLLDDEDVLIDKTDKNLIKQFRDEIFKFIKDNFEFDRRSYTAIDISKEPNKDGKFEVSYMESGGIRAKKIESLTNGLFIWKEVKGDFRIESDTITNFDDFPRKIGGAVDPDMPIKSFNNFPDCDNLVLSGNKITSLIGIPKYVKKLHIIRCPNLKTLKGCPTKLESLSISDTPITDLKGAPQEISDCMSIGPLPNLVSFDGCPKYIRELDVRYCPKLTSLDGCPKDLYSLYITNVGLVNFVGGPQRVERSIHCTECDNLETLEGFPKEIGGRVVMPYNKKLISLKGMPEKIGGNEIDVNHCYSLISVEDAPKDIMLKYEHTPAREGKPVKICPKCGHAMSIFQGKYGPYYSCTHWPKCKNTERIEKPKEETPAEPVKPAEPATPICPKCGSAMVKRKSIYGEFWGCSNYPRCKHIEKIKTR